MFTEIIDAMKKASQSVRKAFELYINYLAKKEEREFYDRVMASMMTDGFPSIEADESAARALLLRQERFGMADVISREALHGTESE